MCNTEDVGGRARVTRDEERVLRRETDEMRHVNIVCKYTSHANSDE